LDDWIYCTLYIHTIREYRQYSAIADLHTFQFIVSVFNSRILATDSYPSHCNLNSHMKSSCHSLISLLSLFCSCQVRRRDSTTFDYCSVLPLLLDYTCYFSSDLLCLLTNPRRGPHGKHPCFVKEACLLVRYLAMDVLLFHAFPSAGMCLASRCLPMGVRVKTIYIYVSRVVYPHRDFFKLESLVLKLDLMYAF
jgi:hypothetical protein